MSEKSSEPKVSLVSRRVVEVAVVGLVIVILSVLATLLATGTITIAGKTPGDGDETVGYRNVTLTDVELECLDYAKRELGSRIKNIYVDNHSSRYDARSFRYKVFLEADLYAEGASSGPLMHHYINCFSRADRLAVVTFEVLEDRDLPVRPIRQSTGGNTFGI